MKIILAITSTFVFSTFLYAEDLKRESDKQINAEALMKHVITSFHPNRKDIFYGGGTLMNLNFGNKNGEIQELDSLMIKGDEISLEVRLLYAERLLSNEMLRLSLVSMNMLPSASGFAEEHLTKELNKISKELKKVREVLKITKSSKANKKK